MVGQYFTVFSWFFPWLASIESLEKDGKGFYHKSQKTRSDSSCKELTPNHWKRTSHKSNQLNIHWDPKKCFHVLMQLHNWKHPESYLSSNCAVSFALLVLSTTPKHPFRQTTPPCSRAPAAKERWIVWRPRCKAIVMSSISWSRHQFWKYFKLRWCDCRATMPHNHWTWSNGDKSHRLRCCTRGSRSHQSKSPVPQYYLDVMLACDAGFHNLNYQVKKTRKLAPLTAAFIDLPQFG